MEDISEITGEDYIESFYTNIIHKSINDFEDMFKDNDGTIYYSNLIHPEFRNFDVLSVDRIAQIFFDNEEKIEHIFSSNKLKNYERLLCFKDQIESKLISHLIDVKVAVENLYEKFQNAVRMRADVTEVKMLLKSIDKFQSRNDEDFCENCSGTTSIACYIDVLLHDPDIIISEKQVLNSEILVETIKLLLQAGGQINNYCENGSRPLVSAITKPNTEFALFLLENGAHVNIKNTQWEWYQPLYRAVENCESSSLVEKIIEQGADLDARNGFDGDDTALHRACYFGNENAIELLIRKGADITLKNLKGETPFATLIGNRQIAHVFSIKILFVKEIAKAEFENRFVSPEDMEIISKDRRLNNLFTKCRDQLDKLKSKIFYPPFSYIDVLNIRNKNARKLVRFWRYENFMRKMAANLSLDGIYNKDLMINFVEAEIIRRKYDKLESILKSTIRKYLSTDLIMHIINFIEVQDLSLFTDREF